jgi:hypothetical protein
MTPCDETQKLALQRFKHHLIAIGSLLHIYVHFASAYYKDQNQQLGVPTSLS